MIIYNAIFYNNNLRCICLLVRGLVLRFFTIFGFGYGYEVIWAYSQDFVYFLDSYLCNHCG